MDSGRSVARYDTTAVGEGLASFGQGMDHAAGSLVKVAEKEDQLDIARAKSNFLTKKIELDSAYSKDTGYTDLTKRYEADIRRIHDESASFIPSARKRELFTLSTADDVAKGIAHSVGLARKQEADANIADANTRMKQIRDAALQTDDDAERGKLIDSGSQILQGLVDRGFITREGMRATWDAWRTDYAKSWVGIQPPEKQVEVLGDAPKSEGQVLDRILRIEGRGKNPKSSAVGAGQFIKSTWLDIVKRTRPDLANGKSDDEILALRADPNLGREMTEQYRKENVAYLQSKGVEATPANQYLAHFLGPAGAVAVAQADPGRPVVDVLTDAVGAKEAARMVDANKSILGGKTAGSVAQWSARKMGVGGEGTPAEFLPYDARVAMRQQAEQTILKQRTAASGARSEEYERQIIDASAGKSPLIQRGAIESDPVLDEPKRNALLRQWDKAAGDVASFQSALSKFQNPAGGPFNPYDKEEKGNVDKIYTALGGDAAALQAVVDRTKTVPESAMKEFRGAVASDDPKRVAAALTMTSNLLTRSPTIFTGEGGEKQVENATVAFRHYVEDYGMTAEDAAKKIIQANSPEYQAKLKARLKSEDVDAVIKKQVQNGSFQSDLMSAFNLGSVFGIPLPYGMRPSVEANPKARQIAIADYAELVKDKYLETGDMNLAKKQAQTQMKVMWGVSYINGTNSGVFMRLPADRAPALANVPDAATHIADQAMAQIKTQTGKAVDRSGLMLTPIPGVTATAYVNGQPAPYTLSWRDKDGIIHTAQSPFIADVGAIRQKVTEGRRVSLEQAISEKDAAEQARTAAADRLQRSNQSRLVRKRGNAPAMADVPVESLTLPAGANGE